MSPLVFSLTSIPPRFHHLPKVFERISKQSRRPDKVELNLPRSYRRFPGEVPSLPELPEWVDVYWQDEDLGPATKVLPTVERYWGSDTRILFSDDDRLHGYNWVKGFDTVSTERPHDAITGCGFNLDTIYKMPRTKYIEPRGENYKFPMNDYLVHAWTYVRTHFGLLDREYEWRQTGRPGYVDIFEGFRGVMVRPGMFTKDAWRIPPEIIPVDDIWLSGHVTANGVGIWLYDAPITRLRDRKIDAVCALYREKFFEMHRIDLNINAMRHFQNRYGIWL